MPRHAPTSRMLNKSSQERLGQEEESLIKDLQRQANSLSRGTVQAGTQVMPERRFNQSSQHEHVARLL